jgi:hypothetical protein
MLRQQLGSKSLSLENGFLFYLTVRGASEGAS